LLGWQPKTKFKKGLEQYVNSLMKEAKHDK